MRILSCAVVIILGGAGLLRAEPLNPAHVADNAQWVVHVDVDALHASTLADKARKKVLEMHIDAQSHMDRLREKIGMDPGKDLHGLTAYGKEHGKPAGVLMVQAKFDQKRLLDMAEKAPDHKVVKYQSYDLHSWTARGHGQSRTVWGAFYKSDLLVFASGIDELTSALDVLDGKKPSLAGKTSTLAAKTPADAILVIRGVGLADAKLPHHAAVVKQIESFDIAIGESHAEVFGDVAVVAKSDKAAANIEKVIEGGCAMAWLQYGGNEAFPAKLFDAVKVSASGSTVTIQWRVSADEVWSEIQKACLKAMSFPHSRRAWGNGRNDKR